MRSTLLWAGLGLAMFASCEPDVDPDETDQETLAGPTIEFDPARAIIPFPNNLLIDPTTGRVNIPPPNCETAAAEALRVGVLNQLDGFGTYETAISVTFNEPVDPASLMDRVLLLQTTSEGMPVSAPGLPIPAVTAPTMTLRFATPQSCEDPTLVSSLVIIPTIPLEQRSTYTVALLEGITTPTGEPFAPSATWALIRQPENPVTVVDGVIVAERTPLNPAIPEERDALFALHQLWLSQQPQLAFLAGVGIPRDEVLLAWQFTTQTVTDPLDPAVAGSPAANITAPLLEAMGAPIAVQSVTCDLDETTCPRGIRRTAAPYSACPQSEDNVQCFLKIALGTLSATAGSPAAVIYATGNATCETIGCAAIGDVVGGLISAKQYQIARPNELDADQPLPGPWTDPYNPALIEAELVEVLGFIPAGPPPAAGHPVVVFGHGLGGMKETAFAIAPQLAASGFMTVAIDFVLHGNRAVRISDDTTVGCDNASQPTPPTAPQCFAPFLSPDLATMRDNIRQSVLDVLTLIADLGACGTTRCDDAVSAFQVDAGSIHYLGRSLGGIVGSTVVAVSPDVGASVLDVAGVGWVDLFENTETLEIRCALVNGLIEAEVLTGEVWTGGTTGLCLTDEWKSQPGYQRFAAIARWILDPADPANFTAMLAARPFLLQEVVGDRVVPNVTTEREAALTGTPGAAAECAPPIPPAIPPSPAIVMSPAMKKFLRYVDLPAGTCSARGTPEAFPGNTYAHGSLLLPVKGNCTIDRSVPCSVDAECPAADTCDPLTVAAGQLGTARLQTDAITYLLLNQ